jgi:hypothetical protein
MSGINRDRAKGRSKGRGSGDSITQSTTNSESQESSEDSDRGRPKVLDETHRTTMTLEKRQVDKLDRICAQIKLNGGENLSRSNVARSLLGALMDAELDFSEITSERELRQLFRDVMG